jgi:DNA-binding beta-propeller fold protein YncE
VPSGTGTDVGSFAESFGIVVDGAGTLYVADTGNHRIQQFDGTSWSLVPGQLGAGLNVGQFMRPRGVAVYPAAITQP